MKKLIITAIVLLGLTSCKKESIQEPDTTITYSVECQYCHFKYEDEHWNRTNTREDAKYQWLNVFKSASITFTPIELKEAKISVSQSATIFTEQPVSLQVYRGSNLILNERVVLGSQGINEWVFNVKF